LGSEDPNFEGKEGQKNRAAQKAIISFNTINILELLLQFQFGIYNPREIDEQNIENLTELFLSSSFDPFAWESMIPIAVNAKHIDLSCVSLLILNMITDLIP
jgi:hypothetical protein